MSVSAQQIFNGTIPNIIKMSLKCIITTTPSPPPPSNKNKAQTHNTNKKVNLRKHKHIRQT